MNFKLPLYRQKKDNTRALASLRMVLAAFGTDVEEAVLEAKARLVEDGTEIGELERLARQFGLTASIQDVPVEQFPQLFAAGYLAMAYIDRAVFDLTPAQRGRHRLRAAKLHVVVPTRVTHASVFYHDPLPPARVVRRSIGLFRLAYERLGSRCIVCSKPDQE